MLKTLNKLLTNLVITPVKSFLILILVPIGIVLPFWYIGSILHHDAIEHYDNCLYLKEQQISGSLGSLDVHLTDERKKKLQNELLSLRKQIDEERAYYKKLVETRESREHKLIEKYNKTLERNSLP